MWNKCFSAGSRSERPRPSGLRGVLVALLVAATGTGCATLSVQDEQKMGRDAVQEVKSQVRQVHDRVIRDYVTNIGDQILAAMGPQPFEYTFYVVDDEAINAFALPGGHIFVHTGVLLKARNVSEVAGVIG